MFIRVSSVVALLMSPAYAQPAATVEAAYPVEVVDRPNVMLSGMNEIGIDYSLAHGLVAMADAMGNPITTRTDFGDLRRGGIGYSHSFGRVELVALRLGGTGGTYANGASYYLLGQSLRAGYQIVHVPRRFVSADLAFRWGF